MDSGVDNEFTEDSEEDLEDLQKKIDWDNFDKKILTENNKILNNFIINCKDCEIVQGNNYQAGFFMVGSKHAGIHSEPSFNFDRIFISVVPGTYDDIKELAKNWKTVLDKPIVGTK